MYIVTGRGKLDCGKYFFMCVMKVAEIGAYKNIWTTVSYPEYQRNMLKIAREKCRGLDHYQAEKAVQCMEAQGIKKVEMIKIESEV